MMGSGFYIRAAIVSLVVALLFPTVYMVLFGYSVEYDPPMDPKHFYQLTYEEQQRWLNDHATRLNGWETFIKRSTDPSWWKEYAEFSAVSFAAILVACLVLGYWEHRMRRPKSYL